MPSPFPGMDPYLEHPSLWPDVHNSLIAEIRNEIAPALRPRYRARLEERTYLTEPEGILFVGRPDVSIVERPRPTATERSPDPGSSALTVQVPMPDTVRETYLEIRAADGEVVTVLELLSPTNKLPGRGRRLYEEKRLAILGSRTSLVEVDLVRAGEPMPVFGTSRSAPYRILVSRGDRRPQAELLLFSLTDPIPRFRLPLSRNDVEPEVDLQAILTSLYDKAGYDLSVDYRGDPVPPLPQGDAAWADALLTEAGQRSP